MAFELPRIPLGPRATRALKALGYVVLGLVTFIYALHLTFPYDRVKDKGVAWLSSRYDVTVGGVERGWLPGTFSLKRVTLRTRPEKPGDQPTIMVIDSLAVDIRLMSSLFSMAAVVELDAKIGPGHIRGGVEAGKDRFKLGLTSKNLPLSDIPGLADVVGLPMGGKGTVNVALDLPRGNWQLATTKISIDCPSCTIGGDGAKIKPRNTTAAKAAWVGDGIEVPRLFVDRLQAEFVIEHGKYRMAKWNMQSPDGDLVIALEGTVTRNLKDSPIETGCIQFRGSDALAKREPKFDGSLDLIGGVLMGDGMRHLKVAGKLGKMKYLPRACEGAAGADDDVEAGTTAGPRSRPSLSNVPDSSGGTPTAPATGSIRPVPPEGAPAGEHDGTDSPKPDDVKPGSEDDGVEPPEGKVEPGRDDRPPLGSTGVTGPGPTGEADEPGADAKGTASHDKPGDEGSEGEAAGAGTHPPEGDPPPENE
ncbi:MAG: type II secretion system protein GspN [Kofleriaceae bacterium]|nr:type II secretion system protein GspN [Kofleriaceae bacterium]MCB9575004.1 type II secretion system protein GspN [Kofleriaceae bacterium]